MIDGEPWKGDDDQTVVVQMLPSSDVALSDARSHHPQLNQKNRKFEISVKSIIYTVTQQCCNGSLQGTVGQIEIVPSD